MTAAAEDRPRSSRPTIVIEQRQHDVVRNLFAGLEVREAEGGMSSMDLRLVNFDGGPVFDDEQIIALTKSLVVYAGDEAARSEEIFRGRVTALEAEVSSAGHRGLVVLAEDALQLARMQRETHLHEDASFSAIAQTVADAAGLTAVVDGFSGTIGDQFQLNESHLAFLRRLLAEYDGDLQVVGSELHVSPRSNVSRGEVTLRMNDGLREVRVCADLAHQVTGVTVTGWDPEQSARIKYTSRGSSLGPGAGRPGSTILRDLIRDGRSEHLGHRGVLSATEAETLANTAFDQRARQFLVLEAKADGDPRIRVGARVRVEGVGRQFDNVYYVTRACHRFDLVNGYETELEAECAFLGDV